MEGGKKSSRKSSEEGVAQIQRQRERRLDWEVACEVRSRRADTGFILEAAWTGLINEVDIKVERGMR